MTEREFRKLVMARFAETVPLYDWLYALNRFGV